MKYNDLNKVPKLYNVKIYLIEISQSYISGVARTF